MIGPIDVWSFTSGAGEPPDGDDARMPVQPSWYNTAGFRVLIAGLLSYFFGRVGP